ncbi:sn-glycerol-3-phosphate ABC transporter ATP-binding protein UgpC [Corynebacterium testudinoris]|uniref:Trehalose import ATP-binding protein SugC n=1 Tax=Corynebacterium testudinoris TaxID=136857 RepID=A0A0G3H6T8_9CORY|nr:sn-glycerol-3-phosphate ABC transporter ATP-binding protein UgpC [Corynebacterium testudinoris]AKK09084.1 ATPase component of ABC-type sugar transporter [Corynebacterium testudinoris]MBX8995486.1 sn-glycerol-3-phosphate ABC transporter ATP-binding protein UgpC [Corynebacterium testudinoris]
MAEIELKNLTKLFPDGSVGVDKANLHIKDGEFIILVGPSGSGKSTALNMIAGLEDISDGDLLIGGTRVNDVAPKDRDIAMVFQSYALYPHMTVRENIEFPLKLAKTPQKEIDEKVAEAARILDLDPYLDRKPSNLSGGQRQRVAMGRAIVRRPKVFLMDEPLSNLDAKLRVQMRAEISRLQDQLGVTTVYVTHDQTEAMTLGDRVVVMKKGVIQQVGEPQELYDHPRNLFIAGFIGSPSMNFTPGQLNAGVVSTGLGDIPLVDELASALGGTNDRRVIVGVRPEAFEDASLVDVDQRSKGVLVDVDVEVLESMGSDKFAHFRSPQLGGGESAGVITSAAALDAGLGEADTGSMVARLSAESPARRGEKLTLWFDPAKVTVFDAETGDNLGR